MADESKTPERKTLRLKSSPTKSNDEPAKPPNTEPAEGQSSPDETSDVGDPASARDAESVGSLKRVRPDASPATAAALPEEGRSKEAGSDTVRLKVVRDKAKSGGAKSGGQTVRLRPPASESSPAPATDEAQTEEKAEPAGEAEATGAGRTLHIHPASADAEEKTTTHTSTLRVQRPPEKLRRKPSADGQTIPVASSSEQEGSDGADAETGATMKVGAPTGAGAQPPAKDDKGETRRVASAESNEGDKNLRMTVPVRPVSRPSAEASEEPTKDVSPNQEKGGPSPGETQAPVSTQEKTGTARLERVRAKRAATPPPEQGNADAIRIKPPSKMPSIAEDESDDKGEAPSADASAPDKGTGKITLKIKRKGAGQTMALSEAEDAKDTVDVDTQGADETAKVRAGTGPDSGKTLRIKGASRKGVGPSTKAVEEALEAGTEEVSRAEPGVVTALAAAATLVAVGVLTFFVVYQYLALFTAAI